MEKVKLLDISKLPKNAQTAMTKIYNLLLNKNENINGKKFQFIINNPLTIDKIKLPSRDELHDR